MQPDGESSNLNKSNKAILTIGLTVLVDVLVGVLVGILVDVAVNVLLGFGGYVSPLLAQVPGWGASRQLCQKHYTTTESKGMHRLE